MSKILRRPMFRGGGKVPSYGTGIASGLASDGRERFFEGGISTGMMEELTGGSNFGRSRVPVGSNVRTGASLLSKARSSLPLVGRFIGPGTAYAAQTVGAPLVGGIALGGGLGMLTDWAVRSTDTPLAYQTRKDIMEEDPFAYAETDMDVGEKMARIEEAQLVGEAPGLFPRGGREKFYRDKGLDPETGQPLAYEQEKEKFKARLAPKKEIEDLTTTVDTDLNGNIEQKPELTAEQMVSENKELFAKLMGRDKAIRQDVGDVLGAFSRGALSGGLKEGLKEATKVESRKEKIDLQAAALAINDYIAGKRSKENLNQVLSQIDYKVAKELETQRLTGDWISDLRKTADRYRGQEGINSVAVIKDTLFQYGAAPSVKSFPKKNIAEINPKDLSVGYNIVIGKDGRKIIEKSDSGQIIDRSDRFPI